LAELLRQRAQSGGVNPVIVGDQNVECHDVSLWESLAATRRHLYQCSSRNGRPPAPEPKSYLLIGSPARDIRRGKANEVLSSMERYQTRVRPYESVASWFSSPISFLLRIPRGWKNER
jgi:hypothetical protein